MFNVCFVNECDQSIDRYTAVSYEEAIEMIETEGYTNANGIDVLDAAAWIECDGTVTEVFE